MANVHRDPASGRFRIKFRHAGVEYQRSIKTADPRVAGGSRGRVEETLRLLATGRIELPAGVVVGQFVMSDGKVVAKPEAVRTLTLAGLLSSTRRRYRREPKRKRLSPANAPTCGTSPA